MSRRGSSCVVRYDNERRVRSTAPGQLIGWWRTSGTRGRDAALLSGAGVAMLVQSSAPVTKFGGGGKHYTLTCTCQSPSQVGVRMWSDNEAVVDLLNVQHLVGAVVRVIKDDQLDPVTVGVYGDWGSGKSSVINLLRERIAEDPDVLAIYFNGWRFEGYEDAKAALASTILEQIQEEAEKSGGGKLTRVKGTVLAAAKDFWGRIDKLRLGGHVLAVGANAGIAVGAVAGGATAAAPLTTAVLATAVLASLAKSGKEIDSEKLASLIKARETEDAKAHRETHVSVRDFHKAFEELVQKLGVKRLVVIVDDLDRCLPHNVIETLEAIRLFLAVPKTGFVITADEALIREAVASRFAETQITAGGESRPRASVAARYLEKLIQVPIRVPPLSPSDLHGYLNLLFAEQRATDAVTFAQLCERVRAAAAYDAVSFHAGNAEELLGQDVSDALRSDFLLVEQIAPVLALCAEGNPRQTKRFLNALVLRLQMSEDRKVTLDRAVAAKMLLLEYFLPELFRTLALDAVAHGGRAETLAELERDIRGEVSDTSSTPRVGGATGTFAAQASTMLVNERFRTWLRADPPLGTVDLRPYVYFANERFALPVGLAQRLSAAGSRALAQLLGGSESEHGAAAEVCAGLPLPEVATILAELTARARGSGVDLQARTSPLHAMVEVAKKRPEVGSDVIAAILGVPYEVLPAGAALLISSLARLGTLREPALHALRTLDAQEKNPSLAKAAGSRLRLLESADSTGAQR